MLSDDSDSEGAGLTYSLTGGADQSHFSVDAATGVVSFRTPRPISRTRAMPAATMSMTSRSP